MSVALVTSTAWSRVDAQQVVAAGERDGVMSGDALLARPVTVSLKQVTVKEAIDSVASLAHIVVQYRLPMMAAQTKRIDVRVKQVPVGIVLERIFDGTTLRAVPDGRGHLFVVDVASKGADSTRTPGSVTGRVVDSASGRALTGATVKIAGTKLSTLTADSGRFTIKDVPPGDYMLAIHFFGFRAVERALHIEAGERTTVRIPMRAVPNVLSGVVTTATGTRSRSQIGNDITVLNADSIMRVAPVATLTDLLESRVPGLTVMHTSGIPGSPSRLRLRGASSVNANNDPIVIIDGMRHYAAQSDARNASLAKSADKNLLAPYAAPSPLDQIDPNTIETVEVFKGPSASSLYGSDAANGVIVITTKKGRPGPVRVSAVASTGMSFDPRRWPLNYYRFGESTTLDPYSAPYCQWYDASCRVDSIVAFQAMNDPRYTMLAHGTDQSASITVSGGPSTLSYSLTGSAQKTIGGLKLPEFAAKEFTDYYHQPVPGWMRRPDNLTTRGLLGTVNVVPTPKTQLNLTVSLFQSNQQQGSLNNAVSQLESRYFSDQVLDTATSPLQRITERATLGSLTSEYRFSLSTQPVTWLPTINADGGLSTAQRMDETLIPNGINAVSPGEGTNGIYNNSRVLNPFTGITTLAQDSLLTSGRYSVGRGTTQDVTLNARTTFHPAIQRILVTVGANYHDQSIGDFTASTRRLDPGVNRPTFFRTDSLLSEFGQSSQATSTYGWFVEPQFHISDRLHITPSLRLDGGSASGSESGSSAGGIKIPGLTGFPKTDFSWQALDRLDQAPLWGFLSLLRPRGSFGYAGVPPAPGDRLRLLQNYGTTPSNVNRVLTGTGVGLVALGNTELRPERSVELEGGADVQLWGDRVQVTYTRWGKTRRDAILDVPVAASVWDGTYRKNVGEIRNNGTELQLTLVPVTNRTVSWTMNMNMSSNHDIVVRLNDGQDPIDSPDGTRIVPGYPLTGRWSIPIVSYADDNKNGVIDPYEIRYGDSAVYVGEQSPNYQMNVTNDVLLFGFGIHATVQYQNGLTQFNGGSASAVGALANDPASTFGTQAAVLGYVGDFFHNGAGRTNIGLIQTVNTLRLSQLSINYAVSSSFARKLRVPLTQISLMGQNLALHTNYHGNDPAVNVFATGSMDRTVDTGIIPEPRSWTLSVRMGSY